jgi:hypothetical protein
VIHLIDERKKEKKILKNGLYLACECVCVHEKEQNKSSTPTSIKEAANIHKREARHLCKMCARNEIF